MLMSHLAKPIRAIVYCITCLSVLASGSVFPAGSHDLGNADKTGIGEPSLISLADRTIEITMQDIFFNPENIYINPGETIRFKLRNDGQIVHEFNIGTSAMHKQHRQEMLVMSQHGMVTSKSINTGMIMSHTGRGDSLEHDDPNSKLLEPGESADLVWKFTNTEVLEFACNIPGHYESGMVGTLILGELSEHNSRTDELGNKTKG